MISIKTNIKTPFFVVNPKSYLYGDKLLKLALEADKLAKKFEDISIFFTAPFMELGKLKEKTENLILTSQHMDGIFPGRGMGHVLPESLFEVGVRATFLNHAEQPLKLNELVKSMKRADELGIITIVCADSIEEAVAIAKLKPDILLCEPTELIGTGTTSDLDYINKTTESIKAVDENILVMQAAGISTGEDVYNVIKNNADGTGATSGILKAQDPKAQLRQMINSLIKAKEERQ